MIDATKIEHINQYASDNDLGNLPFAIIKNINGINKIIIDNFITIPVFSISSELNTSADISIYNPAGEEIGFLTFTSTLSNYSIAQLTDAQLVAYLASIDLDEVALGTPYLFRDNYIIIKEEYAQDYLIKYYYTAPLWGRFTHLSPSIIHSISPTQINIIEVGYAPGTRASNLLQQSVLQPFPAERILKLYHVLESDFDKLAVVTIQSMNIETDYFNIGKIMTEFGQSEVIKLKRLLKSKITSSPDLIEKLNLVIGFQDKAEEIFHTFGKETNPFKDVSYLQQICIRGGFTHDNVISLNPQYRSPEKYTELIIDITVYWIYRIRCCIAHNKVGDYSFQQSDEPFLVEFAEPLLRAVLVQYLR